ncbi:hypothetical protein [Nocardia jinanensis]|uniref:Uncharacterized protein n=1 Tax=Nocardia jinanensis TaxID=382504 RepID=A0A917RRN5_9NOCA|nr:hypothetical protein [Nocardia jinanensis]GGL20424.1 hypothetical protein GCM10011588_39060 [Nocardia jinanensis]
MLTVLEAGTPIDFSFADLMKYHGPEFPGGVAHAYCAMRHAVSLLGAVERREVTVRTAFPGPGGRDAVEMVLRAVTGDRFTVDPGLAAAQRGPVLARYVWEFTHGERTIALQLRDAGFVTTEFIELGARRDRDPAENARLTVLKQEMTDRLLAGAVGEVYEAVPPPTR